MKSIVVFVGLLAFATANVNPITSGMIPIEPAIAKYLSSLKFSLKYGAVDRSDVPMMERFDPISTRLVSLMEDLRESFETGTETLPPLDPHIIDSIGPIDFSQTGVITGTLNIQNIETRGLKQFIIDNMTFSLVGMTLRFSIRVPIVTVNAQYQLESRVATFIPYNPSGDARLQIEEISAHGFAGLGQRSDGFLKLSSFKVNFNFSYFNAHIDGVIGDGLINSYFNLILNELANGVLNEQTELISEVVTEIVRDSANDFIGQYQIADLLF